MTSPASPSDGAPEPASRSRSFDLLHPAVQRWIWQRNWNELRDAQEAAIPAVLGRDRDILIAATTAAGKTEAAFLPIVSLLAAESAAGGVRALYVAPLKALINDQFRRVEELCDDIGIPVARWHGDVSSVQKKRVVKQPEGVLLITPESLESLFINHGTRIPHVFESLGHVVIDELHAFIGRERGRQLQSLLARLEARLRRRVPRVGLSATLGDMSLAADYLRPGDGSSVLLIESASGGQEVRLQVRGYRVRRPDAGVVVDPTGEETIGDAIDVAQQLFRLRGSDNLVFCNTRADVELYTVALRQMCETQPGHGDFLPHHGSLSKGLREDAEAELKSADGVPVTVLCTTTLEMGIDIGSVTSVAQVGPPMSVASLRQRLGRSGRRGEPAILRIHVQEEDVTPHNSPLDAIRTDLVQTIAMVELLLEGWCEPPEHGALHLSTLLQQVLALIAERGSVTAREAHATLCREGPFRNVDVALFATLLRCMGGRDLLTQLQDGGLTLGLTGERLVNHYSFYVVFPTHDEFRVLHGSVVLGQILFDRLLLAGQTMIFAGKRWLIESVDLDGKTIYLSPRAGGRVPRFGCGSGALVHERVRKRMKATWMSADVPRYLDERASELLKEGRQNFLRLGLDEHGMITDDHDVLCFPWAGDKAVETLGLLLAGPGVGWSRTGPALSLQGTTLSWVRERVRSLNSQPMPSALDLAMTAPTCPREKYEHLLEEALQAAERACRQIDMQGAAVALADLAAS